MLIAGRLVAGTPFFFLYLYIHSLMFFLYFRQTVVILETCFPALQTSSKESMGQNSPRFSEFGKVPSCLELKREGRTHHAIVIVTICYIPSS